MLIDRNRQFKKEFQVQGKIIPKPGGADTSKLYLTKQYMICVCAKFNYNWSKTVGGAGDTKLLTFHTQTDPQTHGQTG